MNQNSWVKLRDVTSYLNMYFSSSYNVWAYCSGERLNDSVIKHRKDEYLSYIVISTLDCKRDIWIN